MRVLIAFLLPILAAAQPALPPALEIRGIVTEVGSNAPAGEAEVTVEAFGQQVAKTTTDLQGAFAIVVDKPGTYSVRVSKAGYTDDGKDPAGQNSSINRRVSVDKDHPAADLRFRLARAGELRGTVIDGETGKPIPNFEVFPISLYYHHGEISEMGGHKSATDTEGRFATKGLMPGRYLVAIGPQDLGAEELLKQFTREDLEAIDHDYRRAYWPGGGGLDLALPVEVQAGGIASVGTIQARKVPYYRIHVTIPAGGCQEGDKVFLDIEAPQFIGGGGGEAACGKDFLLRNFEPGAYEVHAMAGNSAGNRMRTTLPLYVINKNAEITLPLAPGVKIEGRVVVAEGSARPPMDKIQVHMWSTGNLQYPDEREPAVPDPDGNFQFPNRPLARVHVWATGLGSGFVVREWRYNGSQVVDNIFALNRNAPQHTLEMVLDDKPAALIGTVTDGDAPIAKAHVVLIRWPASPQDVYLSSKIAEADDKGQFQYAGLAPGEYRILAVAPDTADKLDEPHVLEQLLSRADKVELSAGASQTLLLKVTDPSR